MRFVDTSFWIGLAVPADRRHAEALLLWHGDRRPLRTSNLVAGETWTWLKRRAGHTDAFNFITMLRQSERVSVATVDAAVDQRAWEWLARHDERSYSYVDATSFEIMRRERITEAFAFDGDFSAAGFVEVRP